MTPFPPSSRGRFPLLLLPLLLAACGDGGNGERAPVPEATPLRVEPLDESDLAGLEPAKVAVNIPWGGGTVSRDQVPAAARATLLAARTDRHGSFDRLVLEFGTDAPFPGYRVSRADSSTIECEGAPVPDPDGPRALLVRLRPAQSYDDDRNPTISDLDRRLGFPAMASARQLCDASGLVEWLIEVADSTAVRVLEMRDPPRLVVDVAHPGAAEAAEPPPAAAGDSAAGGG
ncbi:MAG: hypothetical protein KY453_01240 [Gemmatimonadetes bacterium]|nr:hypothetical protein [Gemmatimonadota bacterium]